MSDEQISPTAIMAEHAPKVMFAGTVNEFNVCAADHGGHWPCLPYRLAQALVAERERVARVTACAEAYGYERIPLALDDRPYTSDAVTP